MGRSLVVLDMDIIRNHPLGTVNIFQVLITIGLEWIQQLLRYFSMEQFVDYYLFIELSYSLSLGSQRADWHQIKSQAYQQLIDYSPLV